MGPRPRHRGFTVVEVLLALAIMAILMVAVGSAMSAGAHSLKGNTDYAQTTQTARMAVQSISTAVRTSYACDVDNNLTLADVQDGTVKTATGSVLYVAPSDGAGGAGAKVAYVYDAPQKKLLLDTTPAATLLTEATLAAALPAIRARMTNSTPTVFLLADNVDSASFTSTYDQRRYGVVDADGRLVQPEMRVVSLLVTLKVNVGAVSRDNNVIGGSVLDLRESVVPRASYEQ